VVNTSGGGDSIILTPTATLAPNTQYTFVVTAAVADTTGSSIVPYQMSFTTGAAVAQVDPAVNFRQDEFSPPPTGANFTDVKIGPDGKLYASTEDGRISAGPSTRRNAGNGQIITSIQTFNNGKRLITALP